jgi:threonine/homoserine/homoserine lactone efflux protein
MIDPALAAATAVAAMLYVLSPGPAVLALVAIGAANGRAPAAWFVAGHLAGDLLWSGLALVSLVGAGVIEPRLFVALAVACGLYLTVLGWRSLTARSAAAAALALGSRPFARGVVFGLTNPKSYPVALAMFTALVAGAAARLGLAALPGLLAAAFVGFVVADVILVWGVGTRGLRWLYERHGLLVVRATGGLFVLFGLLTLAETVGRLFA